MHANRRAGVVLAKGRAVEPDITIESTPEALASGDDNVLQRALEEAQAMLGG